MEIRLLKIGFGLFLKVKNTKKNIFSESYWNSKIYEIKKQIEFKNRRRV